MPARPSSNKVLPLVFALWALGCSAPDRLDSPLWMRSGSLPEVAAAAGRLYSVAIPVPVEHAYQSHAADLAAELDRIRSLIPAVTMTHLAFDVDSSSGADWKALLDVCQEKGFGAGIMFASRQANGTYNAFRPVYQGSWQWSGLGDFVADPTCIGHPSLYAILSVDEPWEPPGFTTDELKDMYLDLKARAGGIPFRLQVSFSRQIWRRIVDDPIPGVYWDYGICDVVGISGLEFQDFAYQDSLLDQNHYWSRRIIHEITPDLPVWTSVQVFGRVYGPGAGYWFPRERNGFSDLGRLLDDLTAPRYEGEHPLTGMMFQSWDSQTLFQRSIQYTLGDRDPDGNPVSQVEAAGDAISRVRTWIRGSKPPAPGERRRFEDGRL